MTKLVLFLKSHVKGYTRHDGTFVAAHEDKRLAKPRQTSSSSVKLKQGNVQIKERLSFTKDPDWGDYTIHHPKFPSGSRVDGKTITIKNGKVIGMTPALARQLGVETAGEVQGLTDRNAERKARADEHHRQVEHDARIAGAALGIVNQVREGNLSHEEARARLSDLNKPK